MELFTRSGKRLKLNQAGARFLESSLRILREVEQAHSDMQTMTSGQDLTIRIGFAGKINEVLDIMWRFRNIRPDVRYDLKSDIESIEHLDINDFDVLIYPDEPRYARFNGYPVGEEKYLFAVAAHSPLSRSAVASPALMRGQDFVFLRRGLNHIEYPYRICTSLALDMRSQSFADSRGAHRRMISMGMAVGFVPEGEVKTYSADRQIKVLPILDKRFSRRMMVCFKREKHLSDVAREFKDYLMEKLQIG